MPMLKSANYDKFRKTIEYLLNIWVTISMRVWADIDKDEALNDIFEYTKSVFKKLHPTYQKIFDGRYSKEDLIEHVNNTVVELNNMYKKVDAVSDATTKRELQEEIEHAQAHAKNILSTAEHYTDDDFSWSNVHGIVNTILFELTNIKEEVETLEGLPNPNEIINKWLAPIGFPFVGDQITNLINHKDTSGLIHYLNDAYNQSAHSVKRFNSQIASSGLNTDTIESLKFSAEAVLEHIKGLVTTVNKMMSTRNTGYKVACMDYRFYDEHLPGWRAFWEEMGGCSVKMVEWAKNAGIDEPEQWYQSLHRFLFGLFSGDEKLLKQAAKSQSFGDFIKQTVENHVASPKPSEWYINKGMTPQYFVGALERALEMDCDAFAVNFLNSKTPELGSRLYDEYTLSLTGWKSDLKQAANALNRKAFSLEDEVFTQKFYASQKIRHAFNPDHELEIVGMVDRAIVAKYSTGCISVIEDVWNILEG